MKRIVFFILLLAASPALAAGGPVTDAFGAMTCSEAHGAYPPEKSAFFLRHYLTWRTLVEGWDRADSERLTNSGWPRTLEAVRAACAASPDQTMAEASNAGIALVRPPAPPTQRSPPTPKETPEPFAGNPAGDVTIVEFFDYQCGICKSAVPRLVQLLAEDPNLKLVYKEWPIFGANSQFASRAALAAHYQDRYRDFHEALFQVRGDFSEAAVLATAGDLGLDVDRLKADMKKEGITRHLTEADAQATEQGFTGSPSFLIGGKVVRGLPSLEGLRGLIAEARS